MRDGVRVGVGGWGLGWAKGESKERKPCRVSPHGIGGHVSRVRLIVIFRAGQRKREC